MPVRVSCVSAKCHHSKLRNSVAPHWRSRPQAITKREPGRTGWRWHINQRSRLCETPPASIRLRAFFKCSEVKRIQDFVAGIFPCDFWPNSTVATERKLLLVFPCLTRRTRDKRLTHASGPKGKIKEKCFREIEEGVALSESVPQHILGFSSATLRIMKLRNTLLELGWQATFTSEGYGRICLSSRSGLFPELLWDVLGGSFWEGWEVSFIPGTKKVFRICSLFFWFQQGLAELHNPN